MPDGYATTTTTQRRSPDSTYLTSLGSALRWDPTRKEPYLRLPSSPELRMVPWREGIEDDMVEHFNEHNVGKRLYVLPYPFPRSYAEKMVSEGMGYQASRGTLSLLRARQQAGDSAANGTSVSSPSPSSSASDPVIPPLSPTEITRIEQRGNRDYLDFPLVCIYDTSLGRFVGKVGITPHGYEHANVKYTADEVMSMLRESQMWDISYNIRAEYRGRGVMTEVVGVVIHSWIKPFMRIGTFGAITEADNPASQAVMLKNGFQFITSGQIWDWPVEKGGGTRETGRYELRLRADAAPPPPKPV